jgi:hypothetical protein
MLLSARQEASASFGQRKQISPRMNTDGTDLQIQKLLLNFFDPCKSVLSALSAVRFGVCAVVLQVPIQVV